MITPGLVSATFRGKPVEEVIQLCLKAGLKAIEWSENAHVHPDDYQGALGLYEKTKAAGLEVAAYGSYYKLAQQENSEEVFQKSLVSAKGLNAPLIRIWAGTKASADISKEERKHMAKEAHIICEMAQQENIKIAMEWHKNTLTDTNESALQFMQEVHHPNLYCLWQPTVALDEKQRCEGLALLKDRLLNVHVYYWLEGKRRPFAEGTGFWKQYIQNIPVGDRFGLLEFVMNDTEEQFLEDAAIWIRLLKQVQEQSE